MNSEAERSEASTTRAGNEVTRERTSATNVRIEAGGREPPSRLPADRPAEPFRSFKPFISGLKTWTFARVYTRVGILHR